MTTRAQNRLVDSLLVAAILGLLTLVAVLLTGPNGAWTPEDFAAVNRGVSDAVGAYERLRYPDRLGQPPLQPGPQFQNAPIGLRPPGAPFEIYPPGL